MEVARLALEYVKAFLTPAPLAAGIVVFLLVNYREAIGNVFRLLAAQGEFRRKIDRGARLSYLGGQFVRVNNLYSKLLNDKIITSEQAQGWRTFAEHFKTAYGQAAALWKDVDESSGREIQGQASTAVFALAKALSDFEATAYHHLLTTAAAELSRQLPPGPAEVAKQALQQLDP
jgi:hypothetical protein